MTSPDCLFCRIVAGEIPAAIVYRDQHVTAFRDISPQAPIHLLIVPNHHLDSLAATTNAEAATLAALLAAARQIAAQQGLSNGYRVVINTGADGGQTVAHLHLHLLGGWSLTWPPG
jgi:histidine triad (HIT) family protein